MANIKELNITPITITKGKNKAIKTLYLRLINSLPFNFICDVFTNI